MPDEVIVVNNNSTDNTLKIVKKYKFVRVINENRQGIQYARDAGFDAAKSDIIARIDADTVLTKSWVRAVRAFYSNERNHKAALTGGGFFYNIRFKRFNSWALSQFAYRMNRLVIGHYILWGSNMAIPKTVWNDVKESTCDDDEIHEDMDLGIHVHRKGYEVVYAPSLRVGVMLKRVYHDRSDLHRHMRRWPLTLRRHGYKLWWMGTLGNLLLWFIVQPVIYGAEYFNRYILRRKPLND